MDTEGLNSRLRTQTSLSLGTFRVSRGWGSWKFYLLRIEIKSKPSAVKLKLENIFEWIFKRNSNAISRDDPRWGSK
jgi:hypothetical protein